MFNLKRDGWQAAVDPTICDHERCYNACDLDWTTKWQVDAQGQMERTYEGQRKEIEPDAVSRFLWSQRLEAPERRLAYFIWSPTLTCNYTCAYCGCAAGEKRIKKDFPSSCPELTVDEWADVWSDILERFDYGIVSITGGEPLLSEATIPVLSMPFHSSIGLSSAIGRWWSMSRSSSGDVGFWRATGIVGELMA